MDESRRYGYLSAMGIRVWVPRAPFVPARTAPARLSSPPISVQDSSLGADPAPEQARPVEAAREAMPSSSRDATDVHSLAWPDLADAVATCRACVLCETRQQTVFGVGDRAARLLLIGEAPGADEDRAGEPFVGRAGQLLNRMLAGIGLNRDQVYIANVLKCRPPGNRDPKPEEIQQCEGYLQRQIALIRPRVILCVGRVAAQHLIGTDAPVGRLRGRWFDLGGDQIPLRVTYHPAYLLRSPEQKAKAWADLMAVAQRLATLKAA
ncbi:uracil-DNA glycosylase [Thiocapsa imhoffii]|uniref:Type-4 uracil-DNA glycosylase n=1 Tax=Thiocapsa imhoffii TaxID=382777 RepID=A0A9X0WET4_9GAMM|nr:uracil-DNA glycosylase [Thiocapsa imhoffii]MBK1643347.1 uracil-DNA glycosylase [Thiocapsa imhoffii]